MDLNKFFQSKSRKDLIYFFLMLLLIYLLTVDLESVATIFKKLFS